MPMFKQNVLTKTSSTNQNEKSEDIEKALSKNDSAFSNALFKEDNNYEKQNLNFENNYNNEDTPPIFSDKKRDSKEKNPTNSIFKQKESDEDNTKEGNYLFETSKRKKEKNPMKKLKFKSTKAKKKNRVGFAKHRVKRTFIDDTTIKKPIRYSGDTLYLLRDNTYMKFVQVYPKDIMSRNNNEQIQDMGVVMNMLKQYNQDNKLIALNMPIDTESQRNHLLRKLDRTQNKVYRHFLEEKIEKLIFLEQSSRMERSFLAMMFAETPQQLSHQLSIFTRSMANGFPVKKLSFENEKKILFKFNNQSEEIK